MLLEESIIRKSQEAIRREDGVSKEQGVHDASRGSH